VRDGTDLSSESLADMAAEAEPLQTIIDPDYGEFVKFGNMPDRISAYCEQTSQPMPSTKGALISAVLEGIALKYRFVLERLELVLGRRLDRVHVVGGGTRNRLLNQFTADATGRSVIAGPAEATAIGNVLVQAMALGHLGSLAEGRRVVSRSFSPERYEPAASGEWEGAYQRLLTCLEETA
jgi:rhamnulokinase